jgi:hypothetical protein
MKTRKVNSKLADSGVARLAESEVAKTPKESLCSLFQSSPLRGVELDLSRARDTIDEMRELDF